VLDSIGPPKRDGVTCAIVGARRVEQLQDNLPALDLTLFSGDPRNSISLEVSLTTAVFTHAAS
jgi:aryl-alcohol dehydrogenase-like predicted oxidoreductase